jgi:hypothetical protein
MYVHIYMYVYKIYKLEFFIKNFPEEQPYTFFKYMPIYLSVQCFTVVDC